MRPCFFSSHATATSDIYALSLHDALPILKPLETAYENSRDRRQLPRRPTGRAFRGRWSFAATPGLVRGKPQGPPRTRRSEEHTSELQSQSNLVCRLLLEKQKNHAQQTHRA